MSSEVLRWSDYRRVPWKNGGGTTRPVATGVVGATQCAESFDWRVSIADVDTAGPFSAFPGVDRVITVMEGPGMTLTVDGVPREVEPLSPFAFSGDAATECALGGGAVRDMNVMTRRGRASAEVRVLTAEPGAELACSADEILLVIAASEKVVIDTPGQEATTLDRFDCARLQGPESLTLRSAGALAEIRIVPAV